MARLVSLELLTDDLRDPTDAAYDGTEAMRTSADRAALAAAANVSPDEGRLARIDAFRRFGFNNRFFFYLLSVIYSLQHNWNKNQLTIEERGKKEKKIKKALYQAWISHPWSYHRL
jgi:hypothetical protein